MLATMARPIAMSSRSWARRRPTRRAAPTLAASTAPPAARATPPSVCRNPNRSTADAATPRAGARAQGFRRRTGSPSMSSACQDRVLRRTTPPLGALDGGEEAGEAVAHLLELLDRHAESLDDPSRHGLRLLPQRAAPLRQGDVEGALIRGVADPRDESRGLEALEERAEGGRFEQQRVRDVAHPSRAALPEGEQNEVLRMGEAERLEHRPVEADHGPAGGGESEADLAVECERIGHVIQNSEYTN